MVTILITLLFLHIFYIFNGCIFRHTHLEKATSAENKRDFYMKDGSSVNKNKNKTFKFWSHEFVHCAPEIQKLFESVAQSCMVTSQPRQEDDACTSQLMLQIDLTSHQRLVTKLTSD